MKRRGHRSINSVQIVCTIISISSAACILVMFISVLKLPPISNQNQNQNQNKKARLASKYDQRGIGKLGEMLIEMLPVDLAFTVFIPSDKAFERDLKLTVNNSLGSDKMNSDTYAILTRILGFSVVPRKIFSDEVPLDKEIEFGSLSGFGLYIWKDSDGMLIVNGVRSQQVDTRKKEVVVHVMDGVIMDAEFQQSVQLDYSDEEA